jgi:hypothetical protein
MNYPIDQLSPQSKVWVFLSPRVLTSEEEAQIKNLSLSFIENWTSHQQALKSGFTILHQRFLVVVVDESMNNAGGCSVDKLFNFVKELNKMFGTDFLNRMNVVVKFSDQLKTCSIAEIEKEIAANSINGDTLVFNNLVSTLGELRASFEVPVASTWLNRYLTVQKA